MTFNRTFRRNALLSLGAAIAALSATLVLLFSGGNAPGAQASVMAMPHVSPKAANFRATMSKLWEDHIVWTRMVIVDFAAGLPDLKTAEARLLATRPTSVTRSSPSTARLPATG
jgi:hypothetical protein